MTTEERFWEKVDRLSAEACWMWRGGTVDKTMNTYGRFAITSTRATVRLVLAHRYSWELRFGAIPAGLEILHACDRPACVNPDHLMVGTHRANLVDASNKGRLGGRRRALVSGPVA